jgi:predicted permease
VDGLIHDVKFSLRMLRKSPGATSVAIISLAVGIGIITTVFGWIRGVLINPLPGVADSARIVTVETIAPSGEMIDTSYPDYQTVRDQTTLLSGVIAFKEQPVGIGTATSTERAWAMLVSGNYFGVLGIKPALGRFFQGDEQGDTLDRHTVAVLSHSMWRARFGADRRIVGQTIALNRKPYTIIGVAPEGFLGTITGLRFDLYVPLTTQATLTGSGNWLPRRASRPLYLFARMKPGVAIEGARAEVVRIAATAAEQFPETNRGISATLLPLAEARRGVQRELGTLLKILFAVAAFVMLIVCANVANLQLARGTARRLEIAVRLGLGASRRVIVRQLMTEGIVLGLFAGALGVLVSAWLVDSLRFFVPFIEYSVVLPATINVPELAFAVGASVLASLLFALAPAFRTASAATGSAITLGRQTEDAQTSRIGAMLVAAQVALALTALVAAGLLIRSFDNARRAYPGFDARNVLLVGINLSTAAYSRDEGLRYLERTVDRVAALPGVRRVSIAEDVPLGFDGGAWEDLAIDGYVPRATENMKIYRNLVAPGYFDLMGIRLIDGRDFTDRDTRDTAGVAIVNETFAARYFGRGSAIGRRFTAFGRPVTVVGLVADSKYHALSEAAQPYFYVPLRQLFGAGTGVGLHVQTAGDPMAAAPAVRDAMRQVDPAVPTDLVTTLAEYTSAAFFAQQIAAALLSILGGLALALSAIGLYSLIAYRVVRRRREIGVRMALGATARDIQRLIVGRGLTVVAWGLAAGLALALATTRVLASLLFGVSPLDAVVLAGAAALLVTISVLASYIPGRAAARVDPIAALRAE